MFILGVLSFFQMVLIPGFIFLKYLKLDLESKLQILLYCFGFSLLINYLLVFVLTTIGVYKPLTIYIILLIEFLLLVKYFTNSGKNVLSLNFENTFSRFKEFFESNTFIYKLLFALSIVIICIFFYFLISRIKDVFYLNDPVLAWNRYAIDWYHNHFPVHTWRYPQLIPTNWSIAYMIMQNPDIQFIPRNIMPFFPIGTTFLFLDLGLRKKDHTYFLALIVYGIIIIYLYRPAFIAGGYADIALSFFAFLSFYILYHPNGEGNRPGIKYCLLSVAFASAAAVTKQIGFYILFFILAWNLLLIYKNRDHLTMKRINKILLLIVILIGLIVGPWYVYKEIRIIKGMDKSEISLITNTQHSNRNYEERFIYGFKRIVNARGIQNVEFFIYCGLFFLLSSLFHERIRYVTLFIVIPFTMIWGFLFSYDYRNLTMAFPFIALTTAYGFHFLAGKLISRLGERPLKAGMSRTTRKDSLKKLQNLYLPKYDIPILHFVCIVVPLLVLLNFTLFKKESIIKNQSTQLRNIGDVRLNEKLYKYYEKNGFEGRVFSRYPYFRYLPVLRDYWEPERENPKVHYYLDTFNRPNRKSVKEIKKRIKTGEYTLLFIHNEYRFIKVR